MRTDARPGFSLLEVLVALGVFSLAALALVNLTAESLRSQARVESRTLGGLVAETLAVEVMAAPDHPPPGRSTGVVVLAGRAWDWAREVSGTEDPDLLRVIIEVRAGGELAADRTVYRRLG